jgi:hypothetical protein
MKITIITSCTKPENLPKLYESIDFEHVDKWIIVYDTSQGKQYNWQYKKDTRILEAECPHEGFLGYAQKNLGLQFVNKGSVYFLDDTTIMHPNFWNIVPFLNEDTLYTWDEESYLDIADTDGGDVFRFCKELEFQNRMPIPKVRKGNDIHEYKIFIGMFLVPYKFISNITFIPHIQFSTGIFIKSIYEDNKTQTKYIPRILSYGIFLQV